MVAFAGLDYVYIFISPSGSKQIIKQLNHRVNASESTAVSNQELDVNCSRTTFLSCTLSYAEKNATQLIQ